MSQSPAGRGGKSRIVIDVERVQAEARQRKRRGRGARVLSVGALVVAGLILLLIVGGYAWWQSYKRGPAYSVALLVDAAQRDDMQAVESLIDGDSVAQGFVPQVIEKLTGGDAGVVPPEARGRVTQALPQLLPRVRETMREEVARGVKGFANDSPDRLPFFLLALGVPRVAQIKEQGDTATVLVRRNELPVELMMRRSGERWRVVTVKDDELAAGIAARLAASLPPPAPAQPERQTRRRSGR